MLFYTDYAQMWEKHGGFGPEKVICAEHFLNWNEIINLWIIALKESKKKKGWVFI